MRLARARPANEHHVLRRVGERQRRQLLDQPLIHLGGFEVKAGKVPVQRELGRFHLVTHRCHGPLRVLGLQQMLDQPAGSSYAQICRRVKKGQGQTYSCHSNYLFK